MQLYYRTALWAFVLIRNQSSPLWQSSLWRWALQHGDFSVVNGVLLRPLPRAIGPLFEKVERQAMSSDRMEVRQPTS